MKRILVLLAVIALFGIGGTIWWNNGLKAANPQDKKHKIFVIEKGATVREIGNKLKTESFIRDPVVFFLYVKKEGIDKSIQAGDYRLSPSMSLKKIIETLKHGTLDIWITIPEGFRAEEIAEVLQTANLKKYNDQWIEQLVQNEGFLFPDTYLIPKDVDVDLVITIMRNNFFMKIQELGFSSSSSNLKQVVIMGSLIEREAKTNEEKGIISGILKNRIEAGIPLQVDATIQYAKGYDSKKNSWWGDVVRSDYKNVESSYNTYLFYGLPKGAICNPGFASLKAATSPLATEYLYYIHDKNGQIHYAKTIEEHNGNIARYLE